MAGPEIGRRRFLRAGVGAAAMTSTLAACGGGDGTSTSTTSTTTATATAPNGSPTSSRPSGQGTSTTSGGTHVLPTYVPRNVAKPDLPGTDSGVPAGYLAYPTDPKRLAADPPATGGTISVLKQFQAAAPPGEGQNKFWQELNKRVGARLDLNNVPSGQYNTKISTVLASGDLPDVMTFNVSATVPPHLGDVMKAKFADLTSYLAGDAVKAFPNLAALQTIAWRSPIFEGRIYGVPLSLSVIGNTAKVRQDIFDQLGLDADPKNGQEFLALCKSLTDEKKHRWALGRIPDAQHIVGEMMGVPNTWKVEDGTFTADYATDEYAQMLSTLRQMWTAGYFHPDTLTSTGQTIRSWFLGGLVPLMYTNYTDWALLTQSARPTNPAFKVGGFIPAKWDGSGQAGHYEIKGSYTYVALKQASADRIQELLRVLDWFASPFGSEEFLFLNYGIPGRHYDLKGSDPIETPTGVTECQNLEITYLAAPPDTLYIPGQPDLTKAEHASLSQLMGVSVPLPTVGLISDTQQSKGASLAKTITGLATDIIAGRKPLSAWDAGVKAWLSAGGAQIGHEYEEAYANRPS